MKFPVDGSVEVVKGDQMSAWKWSALATKSDQKAKVISVVYQINNLDLLAWDVTEMLSAIDPWENGKRKVRPIDDLEEIVLDST